MDNAGSSVKFRLDNTTTNTEKTLWYFSSKIATKFLTKQLEVFLVHNTKAHREISGIATLILNLGLD